MGERLRRRPLGGSALALVALEAAVAALGGRAPGLSGLVIVLAPGLALVPLLPERLRASTTATLAAVPALGVAVSSVVVISIASAGGTVNGTSVRLAIAAIVLLGTLALREETAAPRTSRGELLAAAGLLAAVVAGAVLQARVIGHSPVPGNDWAKYVLYADEIRTHGSLLIGNPFWMLGVPFREDPGVPALYGAYLSLTGQPASVLMHGIWAFAVIGILSTFAFVRAFWGDVAGVLAAAFWAVLPINQDILGWHGLANEAALALFPIVLLYLTVLIEEGLRWQEALGFALVVVALAAAHRLSFVVAGLAIGAVLVMRARRLPRGLIAFAAALLLVAPGVVYDLLTRSHTFGGTQSYKAYLSSKVDLTLMTRDLTWLFAAAALLALGYLVGVALRDRRLLPLGCVLVTVAALGYSWIAHVPLVYFRMAYYLPVALVPLVAIAMTRALSPRRAGAAGAALALVVAAFAWGQASNVRDFYAFANPTSLRGLDAVAAELRPQEVVVTDRCWSFLATWLLHTRTLAALEPTDIQPKAELRGSRQARAILADTNEGHALARRLGVRFLVVDPTCTDERRRPARPPAIGRPFFVSEHLVVLRVRD